MKKFFITSVLIAMFATCINIQAQNSKEEYLGLPGDNLNLYAVMKLFQESETLEGFERSLNDQNSNINNLDLNGDNFVDYIRVIDYVDGDVHTIVLQVAIDPKENQDVAAFTVQKFNNGQVQIQLIGDEDLYGRNYIIEPIFDDAIAGQTPNPGYSGNNGMVNGRNVTIVRTTPVVIASWPVIRFIYLPSYSGWRSSWYWGYYPSYWHAWQPYYWHYYYGYHYNWYNDYYGHYRRWDHHRYTRWNDFYYSGRRAYSPNVSVRINSGSYKSTYSRPEQRRDGEALYSRTRSSQTTRPSDRSSGNSDVRRSESQSDRKRRSDGTTTTTTRRTRTTVTNGSVQSPSAGQKVTTGRRSNTTVNRKSEAGAQRSQSTTTKRTTRESTSKVNSSKQTRSEKNRAPSNVKKEERSKTSETKSDSRRK